MPTEPESFTIRLTKHGPDCAARHRHLLVDPLLYVAENFIRSGLTRLVGYFRLTPTQRCRFVLSRLSAHQRSCRVALAPHSDFHDLTFREHEVASLVGLGLNNQEIASSIGCASRTIDRHVSNILSRLGLGNRSQIASLVALTGGWLLPLTPPGELLSRSPVLAALTSHDSPALSNGLDAEELSTVCLRVGSLIPSDQDRYDDALAMSRGEELAKVTNLRGTAPDSEAPVEIVRVGCVQESAQEALLDLVAEGVDALLLGNFSPPIARELLTCTKGLGIPLLHSMVDTRLRDFVGPTTQFSHIFQMCSDETVYIRAFASYIERHLTPSSAATRVTLVLRQDERPVMQDTFQRLLDQLLPNQVQILEYEDSSVDWASISLEIHQFQPDAVFLGIYLEASLTTVLEYLRRAGLTSHLYCVWVPGIPGFVERHPELSEGLIWTTLVGNSGNYFGTRFRRAFESTYGSDPGIGSAAVHFDMVALLRRAWAEADHSTMPDDLVEALHEVQFQGVTGSFHFDNGRRKALCYPFDTNDPTIGQPCLSFVISHGESKPLDG